MISNLLSRFSNLKFLFGPNKLYMTFMKADVLNLHALTQLRFVNNLKLTFN